jgi:glutamine synthetase
MPDPACNPYLALAVQLAAGLDGIRRQIDPGPPIDANVWKLSAEERARYDMRSLPANLGEAVGELEQDALLRQALGDHIVDHFVQAKKAEWAEYIAQVTGWELETYLGAY